MYESFNFYNSINMENSSYPFLSIMILLSYFIVIFIISFNITQNYISKHWEKERCNHILFAGYLNNDPNIVPSEYTIKNMKFCIHQNVIKNSTILPIIKNKYKKIKYTIDYISKQIDLYHIMILKSFYINNKEYTDKLINKINYLKRKQENMKKIYNEFEKQVIPINDKVRKGIKNYGDFIEESKMNELYKPENSNSQQYILNNNK